MTVYHSESDTCTPVLGCIRRDGFVNTICKLAFAKPVPESITEVIGMKNSSEAFFLCNPDSRDEITALQALEPIRPYAKRTASMILMAIEELAYGVDQTTGEWDEMPDQEQDAVRCALNWKSGCTEERPSKGFGNLIKMEDKR